MLWVVFFPNKNWLFHFSNNQFSITNWVSYSSVQFWHYLPVQTPQVEALSAIRLAYFRRQLQTGSQANQQKFRASHNLP